jgi:hypothetical protein
MNSFGKNKIHKSQSAKKKVQIPSNDFQNMRSKNALWLFFVYCQEKAQKKMEQFFSACFSSIHETIIYGLFILTFLWLGHEKFMRIFRYLCSQAQIVGIYRAQ